MTCSNTSSRLMTNLGRDLKRYSPYTVDTSIHIHDHRSLLTGCFIYRLNSIFQLEYIVHHQQFLEALSWQGGGGHRHALLPWKADGNPAGEMDGELEVEVVVELLKSLEKLCPSQVSRATVKKRKKSQSRQFYQFNRSTSTNYASAKDWNFISTSRSSILSVSVSL